MKLLREFIREVILQEFRSSFKINEFKALKDQSSRLMYAREHLPELGIGSSRIVYALPNTKYVLKLARNNAGISQNEAEVELITSPATKNLVADIYDFDKDYYWLMSETVREFKGEREAKTRIGIPIKIRNPKTGVEQFFLFKNWIRACWDIAMDADDNSEVLENLEENFPQDYLNILKNPLTKKLIQFFKETNQPMGDLTAYDHWGMTGNGRIVILDYGYTDETAKRHYDDDSIYSRGASFDNF